MRSTLPLVRGVYGLVNFCLMPSFTQSARKARDRNGEPLSVRIRTPDFKFELQHRRKIIVFSVAAHFVVFVHESVNRSDKQSRGVRKPCLFRGRLFKELAIALHRA